MQGPGKILTTRVAPLACLALAVACGGDPERSGPPDASGTADGAADAPSGPRVRWEGVIFDLDRTKPVTTDDQAPLAGVEVCAVVAGESRTCVTTGSDGRWSLQFPAMRTGIAFSAKLSSHGPLLFVGATLDSDELDNVQFLPRGADVAAFMAACGASAPGATLGGVLVQGYQRVTPAYVALDGGTMSASAGVGPCYMQSPWLHGANQLATSSDGLGYGVFGSVPVAGGTVKVKVELTDATCTASRDAAPTLPDGTIELPVEPGFFTHIPVICE